MRKFGKYIWRQGLENLSKDFWLTDVRDVLFIFIWLKIKSLGGNGYCVDESKCRLYRHGWTLRDDLRKLLTRMGRRRGIEMTKAKELLSLSTYM